MKGRKSITKAVKGIPQTMVNNVSILYLVDEERSLDLMTPSLPP